MSSYAVVPAKRSASRDSYRVIYRGGTVADIFCNNEGLWLWVPAFAGTTTEAYPTGFNAPG
jgi:hypothetical protein